MSPLARTASRAFLLGTAIGGRSASGPAVLALTSRTAGTRSRAFLVAASSAELVADKLPATPSRLQPLPFIGRLVSAAVCGHVLATREDQPRRIGASAAALGAATASVVGPWARGRLSKSFSNDLPGALVEDAMVIALAGISVRTGNGQRFAPLPKG